MALWARNVCESEICYSKVSQKREDDKILETISDKVRLRKRKVKTTSKEIPFVPLKLSIELKLCHILIS